MRWILLLVVLTSCLPAAHGQLLNVEDLRIRTLEDGWYGLADLNFRIRRNRLGKYLDLGTNLKIVRKNGNNRWLAWGSYQLTRFENIDAPDSTRSQVDFSNVGIAHLRYNREISPFITWEAFGQGYYDKVQAVQDRYLVGTGPRFTFLKYDSLFVNMGILYMYEYEENTAEGDPFPFQRNHRMSSYLSAGYRISESFGIQTVCYYQPRLDLWSDYRFTNQSELSFRITKYLSFIFRTIFSYDAKPPKGVPGTQYSVSNGLSLRF